MKVKISALIAASIVTLSTMAFALTADETKVIRKAADAYLSAVPENGYHVLAPEVIERINSGKKDFVIIDVRMPKEKKYDKGHLPGAMYIGFRDIVKPENLAKLPKDKDIILHCDTGHEQNKALSALRMLGYNKVYAMKWGYSAWKVEAPTGMTLKALEGSILNNYPIEQ